MFRGPLALIGIIIFIALAVPSYLAAGPDFWHWRSRGGDEEGRIPGPRSLTAVKLKLYRTAEKKTVDIDLEDYVKGVVAGEMPADFEIEALKAQAVLARTYALKRMRIFGGPGCEHDANADLCDDQSNQVYLSYQDFKARRGLLAALTGWKKIERAAAETSGLMAVYEGAPIEALYHSTSAGTTEDAAEVWGREYPYLKPAESNDSSSPKYRDKLTVTWTDAAAKLGRGDLAAGAAAGAPNGGEAVKVVERTGGGRVKTLRIGDQEFKGTEIREKLGLRSANFEVTASAEGLVFETLGFGHGVGMSQYGAQERAAAGRNFAEIIGHYFPGTRIVPVFSE